MSRRPAGRLRRWRTHPGVTVVPLMEALVLLHDTPPGVLGLAA
ncbi:MAG TPA: hypothetical protein VI751_10570 [Actinomycetota bacterium]